jgi:hypothetical protein
MKTKMILLLALVALFSGCNKIKDATTVNIETTLKADIPVVVTASGKKSVEQTGAVTAITFTKTQDLSLSSNADIEPYLSKIKSIDLNSLVVTITGLSAGQTINSVSLDVTGVGNIFTQTNISMTNNAFTPVIASGILDSVAAKLTSDKKVTLTVSGNASGPMTFTVSLNFDITVTAGVL